MRENKKKDIRCNTCVASVNLVTTLSSYDLCMIRTKPQNRTYLFESFVDSRVTS